MKATGRPGGHRRTTGGQNSNGLKHWKVDCRTPNLFENAPSNLIDTFSKLPRKFRSENKKSAFYRNFQFATFGRPMRDIGMSAGTIPAEWRDPTWILRWPTRSPKPAPSPV